MSGTIASILNSVGRTTFELGFQISPIILVGGVANGMPGQMLPIVALTEAANFVTGLLSQGSAALSPDSFFCHYRPMAGTELINIQVGQYPFANQTVAANAIITQALRIPIRMVCPVRTNYATKLITFTTLKQVLDQHHTLGGLYIVATPAQLFQNCLMTGFRDVTPENTPQVQSEWQIDFLQPLISLQQAAEAQNATTSKLTAGLPSDGSLSGPNASLGNQIGGAAPATQPAVSGLAGGMATSTVPPLTPITSTPLAAPS